MADDYGFSDFKAAAAYVQQAAEVADAAGAHEVSSGLKDVGHFLAGALGGATTGIAVASAFAVAAPGAAAGIAATLGVSAAAGAAALGPLAPAGAVIGLVVGAMVVAGQMLNASASAIHPLTGQALATFNSSLALARKQAIATLPWLLRPENAVAYRAAKVSGVLENFFFALEYNAGPEYGGALPPKLVAFAKKIRAQTVDPLRAAFSYVPYQDNGRWDAVAVAPIVGPNGYRERDLLPPSVREAIRVTLGRAGVFIGDFDQIRSTKAAVAALNKKTGTVTTTSTGRKKLDFSGVQEIMDRNESLKSFRQQVADHYRPAPNFSGVAEQVAANKAAVFAAPSSATTLGAAPSTVSRAAPTKAGLTPTVKIAGAATLLVIAYYVYTQQQQKK